MARHCCDQMQGQVDFQCRHHAERWDCPDVLVHYSAKFGEYGLIIHDGGTSSIAIYHCPWCGTALPESKRDRWHEALAALGFDDPGEQPIPEPYQSDAWYRT